MNENMSELYKGVQISARAQLDALAGEGLELGALYKPVAVVTWRDHSGVHKKVLCDPKRHVFSENADALKIAAAMAKRYIDTKLAIVGGTVDSS